LLPSVSKSSKMWRQSSE
jgi:hypothetical protein